MCMLSDMFCPFCGTHFSNLAQFCSNCGNCLDLLNRKNDRKVEKNDTTTSGNVSQAEQSCPSYIKFMEYKNSKSKERTSCSRGPQKPLKQVKKVQINIGLMAPQGGDLKPVRGKTLPLYIDPAVPAPDLLKISVQKMRTFNKDMKEGPYVLLYPDCSRVVNVPGTEKPFTLAEYKKEIGKTYCRISLFICLEQHFTGVDEMVSESDSEIAITSRSTAEFNEADTLVFEPQNKSTSSEKPGDQEDAMGHSYKNKAGQIIISDDEDLLEPLDCASGSTCYTKYTELYAPCVEEEDEDPRPVNLKDLPNTPMEEVNVTLTDVITNLSLPIDHGRVSRFNISRSNIWDGAIRGFKRATFSETCDMLVRFTDDAGVFEEGIDTGGPRRDFLPLLMKHLNRRPIFDGPEDQRFLVYNANAVREDEYYLAGKMIALSVVHGGPGPHFLSEDLVLYLAGQPSFKATVHLITDEEIRKALQEIESAATMEALRECTLRHSTMLQTAGCLRHVAALEEKITIVADYLRWYIIDRNCCVIERFKDGLSALQFLTAIQLHPALLAPVLCRLERKVTALELEKLFKPDLSPSGSNSRRREGQTLGYWADYLLDCEEGQATVCVEDIFMFATGLTSLPPLGLEPIPRIEFLENSPFPMANTCSNILKLPHLESYNMFKSNMDFGIQNSPGFGLF